MIAKDMFEKLGYKKIVDSKDKIRYVNKGKEENLNIIGIIETKYIEFYKATQEIVIYNTYKHRDGSITESDSGVLDINEFKAIEIQVSELKWC